MFAKKWRRILTKTDVIPSDKPLFSLRFLFILALCATIIFYRFVYIYLYNSPIVENLYDYKISHIGKTYIEGFFLTTWTIFFVILLFRIGEYSFEKILIPSVNIIGNLIIGLLYVIDFIIEKCYLFIIRKKKKDFTIPKKKGNIIQEKITKKKNFINDRKRKANTSLHRSQRKTS